MIRRIGLGILFLAAAAGSAMAQPGDPPSRVARLNYLSGPVSFRPGSVEDWTAATLNYPLTTGDHLWSDAGARSEMHIGSTAIRMDAGTALSILNLNDSIAQISLTEGSVNVRVRYLADNDSFEVDTPNASVVLLRPGDYRINVHGDDVLTTVAVEGGEAQINAGGNGAPLHSGQSISLAGQDQVQQQMGMVPPPDPFDQWCQSRDRRENGMVSARYVPREMIGYEDLDEYGAWREVPGYGMVWSPRGVVAGWAPYHYGHWAWVEPWGWTWVDDAPWGFAPFHYGRWAFAGGGWFWVPGRMAVVGVAAVRPVYAPALVAFVGGGGFSLSVGIGGGGVAAWFPLGPGEVYRPAYHVSAAYVQNINITHVTNVTVINNVNVTNVRYVNQSVPGATVVVSHEAFVGARRASDVAVVVPHEQIMRAQVVGSTAQVAPVRASVMGYGGGAAVVVHAPPERFAARTVVVKNAPPPPPVSFGEKERALQTNGGRPLDANQMNSVRRNVPQQNPMVRTPGGGAGSGAPHQDAVRPDIRNADPVRPPVNRPQQNDRPTLSRPPANQQPVTPQPPVNQQPQVHQPPTTPQPPAHQNEARPVEPKDRKSVV
jgi:hypothetical protein